MFRLKTNKRRVLWVGRKTRAWINARARVKRKLMALGITTCELQYPGCWRDNALSIAHGRKRRKLVGDELETLCILACTPCHSRLEVMGPEGMLAVVKSVIAERNQFGIETS